MFSGQLLERRCRVDIAHLKVDLFSGPSVQGEVCAIRDGKIYPIEEIEQPFCRRFCKIPPADVVVPYRLGDCEEILYQIFTVMVDRMGEDLPDKECWIKPVLTLPRPLQGSGKCFDSGNQGQDLAYPRDTVAVPS